LVEQENKRLICNEVSDAGCALRWLVFKRITAISSTLPTNGFVSFEKIFVQFRCTLLCTIALPWQQSRYVLRCSCELSWEE